MEEISRPAVFDAKPFAANSHKLWASWFNEFEHFLCTLPSEDLTDPIKWHLLISSISPSVYQYLHDCDTYELALQQLKDLYRKPSNEIIARQKLLTRDQRQGETVDQFMASLKLLGSDCDFKPVDAAQYQDECLRDVFIMGLKSHYIRQRLLENDTLTFQMAYEQARNLERAEVEADSWKLSRAHSHPSSAASLSSNFS